MTRGNNVGQGVEYVTVRTLRELKAALFPYTTSGRENARELLLDGINKLKAAIEEHEEATKEIQEHMDEFGGMPPAQMQHPAEGYHYVDAIIEKKMGGKRVGWKIQWKTSDGMFEWDPIADELRKCSGT